MKPRHYYTVYLVMNGGTEYEIYTLNNYDACVRMIENELKPNMKDCVKYRIKEFNVEITDKITDIE